MATKVYKSEIDTVMFGELALLRLRKMWCYRELSALVIAATAFGLFLVPLNPWLFFFPFGGLVVMFFMLEEFGEWAVDAFEDGQERAQKTFAALMWPHTCRELGWVQATGETDAFYVPELLEVQGHADGLDFVIRPLSTQKPRMWPQMAEQLGRMVGTENATFEQIEPGVVVFRTFVGELPEQVGLAEGHSEAWDDVPLGQSLGGVDVNWKPSDVPHLLVAGSTNSGKGSVLRNFAVHALQTGWQLMGVNPRMSGEFTWMRHLGVPVASDLTQVKEMVDQGWDEIQRRQQILESAGVSSWRMLRDQTWAPVGIIVDEAATLLTPNKANKEIAALQTEIGDKLARIAAIGRAVGFHLVMATQRPDATALGPAGGALRNNIEGRIAVGSLDRDGLRMMFGTADADEIGTLDGVKGRALASKLNAGSTSVDQVQLFYVSEEQLMSSPPRVLINQLSHGWFLQAGAS